ncbi:hypothetical protein Nepgr_015721 [Nepenthes gracilis]|uniref:Uncharacterized protein n=1 Tax=Nepenthes gracilis TaxID=150966 RepID=A0AAD3SLF7_NEPGR|nr:hypothetical protein Nepgr_015721 [Nepenthes gracilis]
MVKELHKAAQFIFTVDFWRMLVHWTLSLIISHLHLFAQSLSVLKSNPCPRSRSQSLSRTAAMSPICIVTGATSGLGAAAAHALSKEGFYVVLVGRSAHLLLKTMSEISKENKNAQLKAFVVDLSSFSSIMKFKSSFRQWLSDMGMHSSVQLLINNAGILGTSFRNTADGLDEMMVTNYIGAFCLTKVLLPFLMDSTVPSRVVNVTSFTHRHVNDIQVVKDLITGKSFSKLKKYPFARIYEYSKLCLLLFTYELHRQFNTTDKTCQVSVIAADPGAVRTNIMREVPSYVSHFSFVALKLLGLLKRPEDGVGSILDAALAPPGTSGVYFYGGKGRTISSSSLSYNTRLAERLWTTSCDLFLELKLASMETSTSE